MLKIKYVVNNILPKSHAVPPHVHDCYEFVYYFEADGRTFYEELGRGKSKSNLDFDVMLKKLDNFFDFSDSSYVLFPANVVHNEINKKQCRVLALGFVPDAEFEQLLYSISKKVFCDPNLSVHSTMKKIQSEYLSKKLGYEIIMDGLLTEALVSVMRLNIDKNGPPRLDYFISYVDEYFMTPFSLEELATSCGYSVSHFRALFKKLTGMAPKQYILDKRLEYAKKLLRISSLPVSEVAANCGFKDAYQFCAFFKKAVGESPTKYRGRADG